MQTNFNALLTLGSWSKADGKQVSLLMHKPDPKDLHELTMLFETGSVVPVIDKIYPLNEVSDAVRYLGAGHCRGKVVITM
jgi:NADPH:quinone reductase-like Zn-dependent oxidoreductase